MSERAWRLLVTEPTDGATNMAIDEALWRGRQGGGSPPTLRFFAWAPPTVSLGYGQPLGRDVDEAACRALGVGLVRRPARSGRATGARAVSGDARPAGDADDARGRPRPAPVVRGRGRRAGRGVRARARPRPPARRPFGERGRARGHARDRALREPGLAGRLGVRHQAHAQRSAPAPPGRAERLGVWGPCRGPAATHDRGA